MDIFPKVSHPWFAPTELILPVRVKVWVVVEAGVGLKLRSRLGQGQPRGLVENGVGLRFIYFTLRNVIKNSVDVAEAMHLLRWLCAYVEEAML